MIKQQQLNILARNRSRGFSIAVSAARSGMSERTARKYLSGDMMLGKKKRNWRTRKDPFADRWSEIEVFLELDPSLEARTLFGWLQRTYPGEYPDGQLRSLQRKVKVWRANHGEERQVYFNQVHHPGEIGASDFCRVKSLNITINRVPFDHILYHFVLTYSNWEHVRVCYSETFEALCEGMVSAFRHLGGIPKYHRTDRLSCAIKNSSNKGESVARYQGVLDYYSISAFPTNARSPHENGDVESAHGHFLRALRQELVLRGSSDFESKEAYQKFLYKFLERRNLNRKMKIREEHDHLTPPPDKDYYSPTIFKVRVTKGSTVNIRENVYSVPSRLIGYQLQVRLFEHEIELWYGDSLLERLPRLRGTKQALINYRHLIYWLVRKPGAFKNYIYHSHLFPTTTYRVAYDWLCEHNPLNSSKEYLKILELAAKEFESGVEAAIEDVLEHHGSVSFALVETSFFNQRQAPLKERGNVKEVDLEQYDRLLFSGSQTVH